MDTDAADASTPVDIKASLATCRDRLRVTLAAERDARGALFTLVARAGSEGVPADALSRAARMKPGAIARIHRASPMTDEWPSLNTAAQHLALVEAASLRLEELAEKRRALEHERRRQVTDALNQGLLTLREAASLGGLTLLNVRAFLQYPLPTSGQQPSLAPS